MAIIIEYQGRRPEISPKAFVAPNATLIGDVIVEEDSSIWFGAVLRADVGHIYIGPRTSVQDNVVIHCEHDRPTIIREEVTIGHGAILEACEVQRGAVIGMNAVILQGAIIGEKTIIAAGSVVTPNAIIPPHCLAAGAPAQKKKDLSGAAKEWVEKSAQEYVRLTRSYLLQGIDKISHG